jgi:nucleotide-binding universal stress UspA family protein
MSVIVWIVEGSWPACVDAAGAWVPRPAEIVLLHVTGPDLPAAAHGAYAGLFGRHHPRGDPGAEIERMARDSAARLLDAAAGRLGRPARREERSGRPEHEVVAAAEGADLLICARDSPLDADRPRPGPRSLGPTTRFVVDHAPCPVLLVWPRSASPEGALRPPPPPHPPHPPHE